MVDQPIRRYVVGFLFSPDLTRVCLIEKARPAWQAGKLNGVGGKIEDGEAVREAMEREFREETGVVIPAARWERTVILTGLDWEVSFLRARGPEVFAVRTTTDETVRVVVSDLVGMHGRLETVPNLRWLVPMHQMDDIAWPVRVAEPVPDQAHDKRFAGVPDGR